jgi:hypothetical protein
LARMASMWRSGTFLGISLSTGIAFSLFQC